MANVVNTRTPRNVLAAIRPMLLVGGLLMCGGVGRASALATPHWSDLHPGGIVPAARDGQWMTYDSSTGKVALFGGKGARGVYFNDLWTYAPHTNTWTALKPAGQKPPGRFGHALVYDTHAKNLLVFGGVIETPGGPSNDIWAYSTTRNSWVRLRPAGPQPEARVYPSAVYDPAHREMIAFGGWTGESAFGDTWAYDSRANQWTKSSTTHAPRARWGASMAYDAATGTIVLFGGLFGGYDGSDRLNDTWSYNPATHAWRNLHPAGPLPPARGYAAMDFNAAANEFVLFGGFAGPRGLLSDTWKYNPASNRWSRAARTAVQPPGRDFSTLVYDQEGRKLVLFGGLTGANGNINGTLLNDTWSW